MYQPKKSLKTPQKSTKKPKKKIKVLRPSKSIMNTHNTIQKYKINNNMLEKHLD
jgi:hypothetical protein